MQAPPIEWLLDAASRRPSDVALGFPDESWTWARLADEVLRTAAVLANHGFEPDARIGLVLSAGPEYVTSLLGIMAAGFTAVPLSPLYTPGEYAALTRLNAIAGVITDAANARDCSKALQESRSAAPILSMGPSPFGADIAPAIARAVPYANGHVAAERTAIVFHTAGATGGAKLVPRTHGQLAAECDSVALTLGTSADDAVFCMLPMYTGHGMFNCLFAALRAQCRLFVYRPPVASKTAFDDVVATLSRERSTIVPTIPYQLARMLSAPGRHDLGAIRLCFSASAALQPATFAKFRKRFGIAVRQQYRCTETGAVTLNLDDDLERTAHTVGKALRGVSVELLDLDDSGEGEIFVRSAAIADGYEGLPELNNAVFVDGGFRTGDLGRIDANGDLLVTRRRPICADVEGHQVDLREIEEVLLTVPGVRGAVVSASNSSPQVLTAVLHCSTPPEIEQVRAFCRARLAAYKVPTIFECREARPHNALLSDDCSSVA